MASKATRLARPRRHTRPRACGDGRTADTGWRFLSSAPGGARDACSFSTFAADSAGPDHTPTGHVLVMLLADLRLAHAVRVTDEDFADTVRDTQMHDGRRAFMRQVSHLPFNSFAVPDAGLVRVSSSAGKR